MRFSPTESVAFFTDEVGDIVGRAEARVSRLTSIEFDEESSEWRVSLAAHKGFLFSHEHRQKCIDWEHDHASELLDMHAEATSTQMKGKPTCTNKP